MLLQADEELRVNSNPTYALLLAFMACDGAAVDYLRGVKEMKGLSKSAIDKYDAQPSMARRLNIDLPLLMPEFDDRKMATVRAIDAVRRKRNGIVHSGDSATAAEAAAAIKAANDFVKLLGKHCLYDRHWVGQKKGPA
ncbi:MAG: hypothetical protein WCB12_00920 [Bryobacteraceae bacterium]